MTMSSVLRAHVSALDMWPGLLPAKTADQTNVARTSDVTFELVSTRAAFDDLEHDWACLMERARGQVTAFQTFNWHWHWANHFLSTGRNDARLAIVTARQNGRLILIWPLVRESHFGVTMLNWIGEPVSQYGDVIIDRTADEVKILDDAWAFLTTAIPADLLRLRKVRHDANIAPFLKRIGAMPSATTKAPYLDMSGKATVDEMEAHHSGQSKRNRRRLLRRLSEKSNVELIVETEGASASRLSEHALKLKAEWLKDRGLLSGAIGDPRMIRFFGAVAASPDRSVGVIVTTLKVDSVPAAIVIGFRNGTHFIFHINVFDLQFEKAGVGALALEHSIRDAFARGMTTYDFLAPGDAYKFDWADKAAEISDFTLPLSIKGQAYARVYLDLVRSRAKAWIAMLPDPLRRFAAQITNATASSR